MPRSKEKIKRAVLDINMIENAVNLVKAQKFTLQGASIHFGIPRTTLRRYYHHMMKEGTSVQHLRENLAVKKVFNEVQEKMLVDYIKDAANLQFGLTLKDVRLLAYQFAKVHQIKYPSSWDSEQMAGEYWLRLFRKRYKEELSIHKPEATSLARSSAFNKHTVELTFNDYKKTLSQRPSDLPVANFWNIDETGLSTVHVTPKIVARVLPEELSAQADTLLLQEPQVHIDPLLLQEPCAQADNQSTRDSSQEPSEQAEMHSLNVSKTPQNAKPSSSKLITPEIIRQHPKATPGTGTQKRRPKGKSRILTDTPEKNEFKALLKVKKGPTLKDDRKLKKGKNKERKKPDRVKRKLLTQTDSDDSNYPLHDTDDSFSENENSDSLIEEDKLNYEKEDFVIFIYEEEYFVGKIESLNGEGVLIKSMQKLCKTRNGLMRKI